ncbi:MAG: hypothetical protein M1538_00690 [Candidatus Marsarchaeota archaeon]|jgi:hypothetical protein|nr:hypothetical protein [Candidatus Marsarchaeota archaeon]
MYYDISRIMKEGKIKIRVNRSGMYQLQTFTIRYIDAGDEHFAELFLDKVLDIKELQRVADEVGLPIESQSGRAFPKGKGATDFLTKKNE